MSGEIWPGQIYLCPEHIESDEDCTCGLVPYLPRAEVERLRAENLELRSELAALREHFREFGAEDVR